jgi:hypothetical protein
VLISRLEGPLPIDRATAESAESRVKQALSCSPVNLSAIAFDTSEFCFDREEANAR